METIYKLGEVPVGEHEQEETNPVYLLAACFPHAVNALSEHIPTVKN